MAYPMNLGLFITSVTRLGGGISQVIKCSICPFFVKLHSAIYGESTVNYLPLRSSYCKTVNFACKNSNRGNICKIQYLKFEN